MGAARLPGSCSPESGSVLVDEQDESARCFQMTRLSVTAPPFAERAVGPATSPLRYAPVNDHLALWQAGERAPRRVMFPGPLPPYDKVQRSHGPRPSEGLHRW